MFQATRQLDYITGRGEEAPTRSAVDYGKKLKNCKWLIEDPHEAYLESYEKQKQKKHK
jgi:hypothetical protein